MFHWYIIQYEKKIIIKVTLFLIEETQTTFKKCKAVDSHGNEILETSQRIHKKDTWK